MRNVILHYHLFKNAGSSVDGILSKSFGDQWLAFDPNNPAGKVSSENLALLIENNPEIVAFSSHSIVPPLPQGDFKIFPIVVLRDPIARVMSAYSFEWKKQLGLEKAKGSLTDYIREKFDKPRANAIEDFQTFRLAVSDSQKTAPSPNDHDEEILSQAKTFLAELPVFGLVEEFETSLKLFQKTFESSFPDMKFENEVRNVTADPSIAIYKRHEKIRDTIGNDTYEELIRRNQLDIKLYSYAQGRFDLLKQNLQNSDSSVNTQEVETKIEDSFLKSA